MEQPQIPLTISGNSIAILAKCNDGNVRQIVLDENQRAKIIRTVLRNNKNKISIKENPIENIQLL